jgi:hypothetical protein
MIKNSSKPTKSELALYTELFIRDEIKRVNKIWTQEPEGPRRDRHHAQEQAFHLVLNYIIKNKRS